MMNKEQHNISTVKSAATSKSRRNKNKNTYIKSAHSSEELLDVSTKPKNSREASTPTSGTSSAPIPVFPDISAIATNHHQPQKRDKDNKPPKKERIKKTLTDEEIQDRVDMEYTKYLQMVYRRELARKNAASVENDLEEMQAKIEKQKMDLEQTRERLNNIKFNKEIDFLHSLNKPDYGKVLETIDKNNCEEYLTSLNSKLEHGRNQLLTKNIEMPQGGGAELMSLISETLSAFEKSKEGQETETLKVVQEIKEANMHTQKELSRATDKLATAEGLLLKKAVLGINLDS